MSSPAIYPILIASQNQFKSHLRQCSGRGRIILQVLGKCEDIANSISATTLKDIVNESAFLELMSCFQLYSQSYLASRGQIDTKFIQAFRSNVEPNIKQDNLIEPYFKKLILYRKLAGYKVDFVVKTLYPYLAEISHELTTMTPSEKESQEKNLWIARNGVLCASVSQLFFSIEHCCKIVCCLANERFAKKLAKNIPVGHTDLFGVLKHLSAQGFLLDFSSLTKTYAYVIKTRMAADYTEFFYEQFDVNPFVTVLLHATMDIFNSQKELLFECAGI